jgi:hypothetical protein
MPKLLLIMIFLMLAAAATHVSAQEADATDAGEALAEAEAAIDTDDDDTADIDTASTVDFADDLVDRFRRLTFIGDFRPLYDYVDRTNRQGVGSSDSTGVIRLRAKAVGRLADGIQTGARVAWRCDTDECAPDWYMNTASPAVNGLESGQATFDELYLHFFRREKFNATIGRQQTRSVLRGGVFARSLDRNDSNNVNVTWTDGTHLTLRRREGWETHIIVQRNATDGTGSIRRGPLNFDDSDARVSYFVSMDKTASWGPIVQRTLSVSYLPDSLLVTGDESGPRADYWGVVGRIAARWPNQAEGMRLRLGGEIGYAPEQPDPIAVDLATDVDGLAWNVVASLMDLRPGHNVGINFGQTGAGWLLSPNFVDNQQFFEVRYLLRSAKVPPIDVRFRWREDIEQRASALQKREVFDMFVRMTFQFGS